MSNQTPFFITVTSEVLRDKDLNPIEKLIFTEIMALTYSCGYCYASNSHFANIFDRAVETISRNISKLQSKGYIYTEININDGNSRKIYVKYTGQPFPLKRQDPIDENVKTLLTKTSRPIDENVKHSNTISKSISKSLKKDVASDFSLFQFEEFWNLYDRKVKKTKTIDIFKKVISKTSFEAIINGVQKYNEYLKTATWLQKADPTTWLNGERWNDDYATLIQNECVQSDKISPTLQEVTEKQQEAEKQAKDIQGKRNEKFNALKQNEQDFTIHIQKVLKSYFSTPIHNAWIDNILFYCRKDIATLIFLEDKHLKTASYSCEKIQNILNRELPFFNFKYKTIETKLINL